MGQGITNKSAQLSSDEFMKKCREIIVDYFNSHVDKTDQKEITYNDTYVVWYSKSLQNHKALLSTTVPDGLYYEATYNGDKNEMYLDVYKKWENITYHEFTTSL